MVQSRLQGRVFYWFVLSLASVFAYLLSHSSKLRSWIKTHGTVYLFVLVFKFNLNFIIGFEFFKSLATSKMYKQSTLAFSYQKLTLVTSCDNKPNESCFAFRCGPLIATSLQTGVLAGLSLLCFQYVYIQWFNLEENSRVSYK